MRHRPVKQEPFKSLVSREWKRAKRILPQLRQRQKPKVVWASNSRLALYGTGWSTRYGVQGRCWRNQNRIELHEGYLEHKLYKEFVDTLRHEIAHLLRPESRRAHGSDFMWWLKRLGGSRYCRFSIKELAKQKATPAEVA